MAVILNSAMLDSDIIVFSHLSFSTQKHSHLPGSGSHHLHKSDFTHISLPTICTKKTSLIHSHSTWWWQPSWILPSWINWLHSLDSDSPWWWQPSQTLLTLGFRHLGYLHSDCTQKTLSLLSDSDSNKFNLTQTHLCTKKVDAGIHSWILPTWIWSSWIQPS